MASQIKESKKEIKIYEQDSSKSVHEEISKSEFKGAPRDQYGKLEADPEIIMDAILKDLIINKQNGKPIITFPKWLTNGPYAKKTVDQFISIITNNIPKEYEESKNIEEYIETDPKKLLDLIMNDLKIDLKKNVETGNSEYTLQFPRWFTHGPYMQETVDMMVEKITISTTKVIEDKGLSYLGHWRT